MKTLYQPAIIGLFLLILTSGADAQVQGDRTNALTLARLVDDVNFTDTFDRTLLMHAAAKGYRSACRVLLRRGADPNMQSIDGATAAMFASYYGHTRVVKLLLDKGADPDLQDKGGMTALMTASFNGLVHHHILAGRGAGSRKTQQEKESKRRPVRELQ